VPTTTTPGHLLEMKFIIKNIYGKKFKLLNLEINLNSQKLKSKGGTDQCPSPYIAGGCKLPIIPLNPMKF
jgi:hypothetical protein